MMQEIKSMDDVRTFFNELLQESLNFHPDEDFANYINGETKLATYTDEEARLRNMLMDKAFFVCDEHNVCIYDLSNEMILSYTGLREFFDKG